MNWTEFFFGWLTKGQYETSTLDSIMFWLEFIIVFIVGFVIYEAISSKKDK